MSFEAFDEPADARPFYGLDFGESADPNAGVRSFIKTIDGREELFITHEAFGWRVELDQVGELLDGTLIEGQGLPGVRDWPLKCDNSRPGMIAKLVNEGFNASGAEKWSGSVEDGIAHLKAFRKIHVHPRCKNIAQEFRLYSYAVDKKMLDANGQPAVLPKIVDRWNHGIDALRYSHDGYIEHGGDGLGIWGRLAG
jgi:phage terminase large subunit